MKNGHGMFHHSGSPLSFPNRRSMPRARTRTLPHRAHLRAVSCPPSRAKDGPSARVPPLARPREDSLREAGAGTRLRLRLSQDRRPELLGEHAASQTRRVDRAGSDGSTQADLSGGLRPPHRPRVLGCGGGLLHQQGSLRRREVGSEPGRPRKNAASSARWRWTPRASRLAP